VGLVDRSVAFRVGLAGVFIAALALSACGRKGDPEPPPNAAITKSDAAAPADPSAGKPSRSFVLDPLVR